MKPLLLRFKDLVRNIVRATGGGWHQEKCLPGITTDAYEFIETLAIRTKPTQVQAKPNASIKKKIWTWGPTPNQKAMCS